MLKEKKIEGKSEEKSDGFLIEDSFEELKNIIAKLEDKGIGLEDAFKEYEKGMKLIKETNEALDRVEKKILVLQENGIAVIAEEDEF